MIFVSQFIFFPRYNRFRSLMQQKWITNNATTKTPPQSFRAEDRFRKRDGIEETYKIIYRPPRSVLLIAGHSFFTVSSVTGPIAFGTYVYSRYLSSNLELVEKMSSINFIDVWSLVIIASVSFVITVLCRSAPLRIYKSERKYIAVLPGLIPTINRKVCFRKGDVAESRASSSFVGKYMNFVYYVKGQRIFLVQSHFAKPVDLYDMLANSSKYVRKLS